MNWKGFAIKWSWPIFKVLSWHSLEGLRETTKTLSEASWSPGQNLNLGPSKYEAGVLTTQPQHLVLYVEI
jgi:hypothetical protein